MSFALLPASTDSAGRPGFDFSYKGEITGDPHGSPSAPKLVPASEIKIGHQPSAPGYPEPAKRLGTQGEVLVEVWLGPDGSPTHAFALAGPVSLRETAVKYVKLWKFEVVDLQKTTLPARFRMVMPFKLRFQAAPYVPLPDHLDF